MGNSSTATLPPWLSQPACLPLFSLPSTQHCVVLDRGCLQSLAAKSCWHTSHPWVKKLSVPRPKHTIKPLSHVPLGWQQSSNSLIHYSVFLFRPFFLKGNCQKKKKRKKKAHFTSAYFCVLFSRLTFIWVARPPHSLPLAALGSI